MSRRSLVDRLVGTGEGVSVRCPTDDWEFHPRLTDGACPLCGWRPSTVADERPLIARIDWFFVALVILVAASAVMAVFVGRAWIRT